jgi:hypothetical protein
MFLVGIAGPFLPYLFLLGIVFVFSTQTSAQPVGDTHHLNNIFLSRHHIFLPPSSESFSDGDYLVRLENLVYLSTKDARCKRVKCGSFRCTVRFPKVEEHEIQLGNHETVFKSQLTRFYFFGLSPPALMYC